MSNSEHVAILNKGVRAWNKWRKTNPGLIPDLKRANLSNMHLHKYDLNHARLMWVNFNNSNLRYCNLCSADLTHSFLNDTDLSYADLTDANLEDCDFRFADLTGTIMDKDKINTYTIFPDMPDQVE